MSLLLFIYAFILLKYARKEVSEEVAGKYYFKSVSAIEMLKAFAAHLIKDKDPITGVSTKAGCH